MENDCKVATYHSVAMAGLADERGGRYATEDTKQTVIGSSPISYPKMPEGNPWANEPIGTEPQLGFDINAQDPVGEPHEIRASTDTPSSAEPTHVDEGVRHKLVRRI